MKFFTRRLALREVEEGDLAALAELLNDSEARQYEQSRKVVYSEADVRAYIQQLLAEQAEEPRKRRRLALTIRPDEQMRGWVSLRINQPDYREWEMGWSVARGEWNRGYAAEAALPVMRYAFEHLSAHRVIAFCHAENAASVRVMEKLGMQYEGRTRQTRWINEAWADELIYAILDEEFWALERARVGNVEGDSQMTVPQTKQELIDRVRTAREALEALLNGLDAAAMERPGPDGGWSIKDHLAHLADWSRKQMGLIDGQAAHAALGIDQDLYKHGGIDRVNEVLYQRSRGRSLDEVLADFCATHEAMVRRIEQMGEAHLRRANSLTDPDDQRLLVEGIASNTYEHDEEHAGWIKEQFRNADKG